ncbi:MAG: LysM peptidoglycan-binding domain-containing protein [candidate division Zixibacteria bacterium]|nr:LysM peptidoglycan-binding domain-containing protein [candidate division Zixibacteria bacterium]
MNSSRIMRLVAPFVFGFVLTLTACGGKNSLSTPQIYGDKKPASESAKPDTDTTKTETTGGKPLLYATPQQPDSDQTAPRGELPDSAVGSPDRSPDSLSRLPALDTNALRQASDSENALFYADVAMDDSAAAVDDDIWRQFDLAGEYRSMGVIANREASWEEAQYYFEKALKILAKLDIEGDSVLTPEAIQYNRMLDDIVADYRVTLRSLGHLEDDVSSSAVLERFMDLSDNLGLDTMRIYSGEVREVTYDIPVVMNDRVRKSIIYFQTVAQEAFTKYLRRFNKYTPMMKRILRQYDLPEDLVYLSLVESGFNPHAYSWARAMGLWQFISSTGRLYGLKRNWWLDERKDPIKSTHAACRFLKDLYQEFGAWELAMAAYNGGPGRVRATIKKQKTIDFWKMHLRRQTMDYVPLIMAAAIIGKNPEKYGFTDIDTEPEVYWDEVQIDRCLELSVVAEAIGCTTTELKELNPELLRKYTPPNVKEYQLKIPRGSKAKFQQVYANLPSPVETSWVRHTIRKGETVSSIAARYGVSQYAIFEANNLRQRSKIYAGKELIVPVPLDRDYSSSSSSRKNRDYTANNNIYSVRAGDTMWDIARAFGTTVDALRRVNYIERGSRIYVGQSLKIPSGAQNLQEKSTSGPMTYASNDTDRPSRESSSGSSSVGSVKSYKVRAGDTLWDIAANSAPLRASCGS